MPGLIVFPLWHILPYPMIKSLFATIFFAFAAFAENPAVFTVDMQQVLDQSIAGKAAKNNLKAEAQKEEAKIKLEAAEIQKIREDLDKQAGLLSREALTEKEDNLRQKQEDLAKLARDKQTAMTRHNNEAIEKLINQVNTIVDQIAKAEKIAFVVEKDPRTVIYANPKYDLTTRVIENLNKLFKE